jgi:hypothetical protein
MKERHFRKYRIISLDLLANIVDIYIYE